MIPDLLNKKINWAAKVSGFSHMAIKTTLLT